MENFNQVILSKSGHTWYNVYTSNKKFNESLSRLLELCEEDRYKQTNYFWVLALDGSCVAAQPTKEGAIRYYNKNRVIVHNQKYFI